ncbi:MULTISPECIES: response regulator [Pseudomonas]|uniref:response regulator n=1 Tax=Pseudomonas TaxID=286 RepID=UPI00086366A8|nr:MULTISPECIES: response regulator [Pseudomonas]MDG9892044.1 response regulator [Pseudomonas juntendi]
MNASIHPVSPPHVLLVEDEPALNDLVAMMLEDMGARVTSVCTADEGLLALRSQNWTLLITDVRTPGHITGLDLAMEAKQLFPMTGVIVMSGHYDPVGTPLPRGISFLPKPWPLNTFFEMVGPQLYGHVPSDAINANLE